MRIHVLAALALLVASAGCHGAPGSHDGQAESPAPEAGLHARAEKLAHEILLVDTHVDVPYRLMKEMEDISRRTEKGDFDYPRAKEAGLDAPFMSVYVPAEYQETGGAKDYADKLIDLVDKLGTDSPDKFEVAYSTADVERITGEGKIALPMGMENGAPIEDDLANVKHFKDRGIGYITLTHSKNNQICDSSYEKEKKWKGLSPFGRDVVAEMNRLGIMVDISHVSDDTFYQVMELSKAPAIASHSSCRKFTPGFERNMDDDMIKALAAHGGVIQINFGSAFLTEAANKSSMAMWEAQKAYAEEHGLKDDDPALETFGDEYWKTHEKIYATLDDVVAHIDHVVKLAGVDHVGFGSDFEGVGDSLPEGLKDVSGYPNLIEKLLERGYTDDDIRKIAGGNLMRVWEAVEKEAAKESGAADSAGTH